MKIISKAELLHPGVCMFCNTAENREWFIDTGRSLDYDGTIYVCDRCYEDDFLTVAGATSALDFAVYCDTQNAQIAGVIEHYEHQLEYQRALTWFMELPSEAIIQAYQVMTGPPEDDEDGIGTDDGSDSVEDSAGSDDYNSTVESGEFESDETVGGAESVPEQDISAPTFDFGI